MSVNTPTILLEPNSSPFVILDEGETNSLPAAQSPNCQGHEGEARDVRSLQLEGPKTKKPMEHVMIDDRSKTKTMSKLSALGLLAPLISAALLTTVSANVFAKDDHDHDDDRDVFYRQTNFVSDLPGVALLQDTNLVNAWGVSFSPTSPFWVSDNGTGKATLYSVTNDSSGSPHVAKLGLTVSIPGEGNPTGQVFNNTTKFHRDLFLFVSEDGTISGWRNALGTAAEVLARRTNAVYKGVTLASS